jgi:hypothetical protein
MGKIVEGLLDGGVRVGVSTRGMGSLQRGGGAMMVGQRRLHAQRC